MPLCFIYLLCLTLSRIESLNDRGLSLNNRCRTYAVRLKPGLHDAISNIPHTSHNHPFDLIPTGQPMHLFTFPSSDDNSPEA